MAATLAATPDAISPLRSISAPSLLFPALKAPAVTRNPAVPAGTFDALAVRSSLTQPGFRFGSGTRTTYFAAGKGLVKLVFRHGDGSVTTVDLLK